VSEFFATLAVCVLALIRHPKKSSFKTTIAQTLLLEG
jgi:hypothetical protein